MEEKKPGAQDTVPSFGEIAAEETLRSTERRLNKSMRAITDPAIWFGIVTISAGLGVVEILVQSGLVSKLIIAAPSRVLSGLLEWDNLIELLHAMRLTASLIAAALIHRGPGRLAIWVFPVPFPQFRQGLRRMAGGPVRSADISALSAVHGDLWSQCVDLDRHGICSRCRSGHRLCAAGLHDSSTYPDQGRSQLWPGRGADISHDHDSVRSAYNIYWNSSWSNIHYDQYNCD